MTEKDQTVDNTEVAQTTSEEPEKKASAGQNKSFGNKRKRYFPSKRSRPFKSDKDFIEKLDYKNVNFLVSFVSDKGKILPARVLSLTAGQQRKVKKAIKKSRMAGLLPFKIKE